MNRGTACWAKRIFTAAENKTQIAGTARLLTTWFAARTVRAWWMIMNGKTMQALRWTEIYGFEVTDLMGSVFDQSSSRSRTFDELVKLSTKFSMWHWLAVIFSDFCFAFDPSKQRCVFDCFEDERALAKLPAPPAKCGDDKLGPYYEVPTGYVHVHYISIISRAYYGNAATEKSQMTRVTLKCQTASNWKIWRRLFLARCLLITHLIALVWLVTMPLSSSCSR